MNKERVLKEANVETISPKTFKELFAINENDSTFEIAMKPAVLMKIITKSKGSASFGDSGCPLVCHGQLYGLVSGGGNQMHFGYYFNFFTDIHYNIDWIHEKMKTEKNIVKKDFQVPKPGGPSRVVKYFGNFWFYSSVFLILKCFS